MEPRWSARPARFLARRCTSSPTSTDAFFAELFRRQFNRRDARQDHLDARTAARLRIEIKPPAEARGDDAVNDVKPQARAALVAPRREEGIERTAAHVDAHADTIV